MSSTNTFKVSYEPSTGGGNERVFLFWSNDKVGFIDHVQFFPIFSSLKANMSDDLKTMNGALGIPVLQINL